MCRFVRLADKINADSVNFIAIDNWGTFKEDEFEKISMYKNGQPKKDLEMSLLELAQLDDVKTDIYVQDCYVFRKNVYTHLFCDE